MAGRTVADKLSQKWGKPVLEWRYEDAAKAIPLINPNWPVVPLYIIPSAAGSLLTTVGDYARFAQMLLDGGTFEGRRYLKPETIALMASDHIGPETKIARDQNYYPGGTSGFGLGFAVRRRD